MQLRTKRIYEAASGGDGVRILIDRLWPRGVSRDAAAIDLWAKDLAPSSELRTWYQHDHAKWPEFRKRYFAELDGNREAVADVVSMIGDGVATIVFGSKETVKNNASAFREYLEGFEP